MKQIIHILFYCCFSFAFADGGIGGIEKPSDVYIISIGINKYSKPIWSLQYCVNDAVYIANKIKTNNKKDSLNTQKLVSKGPKRVKKHNIKDIISIVLTDENATLENIRKAFKEVISKASYNDYFVFLFSGFSMESENDNTFLIPYMPHYDLEFHQDNEGNKMTKFNRNKLFSLVEMAKLMEQISCRNQLIISEAGSGTAFSKNLISELFESNPLIAKGTDRNRIILTTKEIGRESSHLQTGFLMGYILRSGNVLDAFYDFNKYELRLNNAEINNMVSLRKYVAVYQEQEYRDILLKNYQKYSSRGSKGKQVEKPKELEDQKPETYAFIIATENYNDNQISWGNLKNPINDADAVAEILSERYNVKTIKVYNKDKNETLKAFLKFKEQLGEKDKLLFFAAGHGYYSEAFSDGYLVMQDSNSLEDDTYLDSYLSMAQLNRILDGVKCKQVFSIFDVCYGASFELNNANLSVENYTNTKMDNGLDTFIKEKDKSTSRIVLASGQYEVFDYWKDSQKHSPFADKLIKALNAEKHFISPGKIFSYVQGNATTPILKQFGKHEVRGDFLLKVN
ncbi:caspase family protein [Seonamhaeicola maritimus]|uniref:caspase family protein n=1 Tax=Seonamhaeicola maritimus TaxID=2591822 RepID=UPI002494437D|nr:caspase family protein [Seonamhaeicola maritimus]